MLIKNSFINSCLVRFYVVWLNDADTVLREVTLLSSTMPSFHLRSIVRVHRGFLWDPLSFLPPESSNCFIVFLPYLYYITGIFIQIL